jgi:hypothetical protein
LTNNTFYYATQSDNGCESDFTEVNVGIYIINEPSIDAPAPASHCDEGSSTISFTSSEPGINYTLVDADNNIIDGPYTGTGNTISFNSGTLTSTSEFKINAERATNTSILFDGSNDYINVGTGDDFNFTGSFSIEFWIKVSSFNTVWQAIMTKGDDSWRIARSGSSNNLSFGTSGLSNVDLSSTTSINDGNWHHIACVYDGTTKSIYVNGVLDNSIAVTGTLASSSIPVLIGENGQQTGRYFNGNLDEIRIWNTARTQNQIKASMNNELTGNESGLLLYYKFNELSGTNMAYDASGNGNNGALLNMDLDIARETDVPMNTPSCSLLSAQSSTVTINDTPANGVTLANITLTADESGATYQWIDCDNGNTAISGETSQSFTPSVTGNYAVEITKAGCSSTSACTNVIVSGVRNIAGNFANIELYPNPTTGIVYIKNNSNEPTNYKIFDTFGKLIASETTENKLVEINISNLANAVYFIHINNQVQKLSKHE